MRIVEDRTRTRGRNDIWALTSINENSTVLVAGPGAAGLGLELAPIVSRVFLLGRCPKVLKRVEARKDPGRVSNVFVTIGKLSRLPFPEGYFDLVLWDGSSVRSSGEDEKTAFSETARVLKKEGEFCLINAGSLRKTVRVLESLRLKSCRIYWPIPNAKAPTYLYDPAGPEIFGYLAKVLSLRQASRGAWRGVLICLLMPMLRFLGLHRHTFFWRLVSSPSVVVQKAG